MDMGFMMLGRWIYIQLSHWCQNLNLAAMEIAIVKLKRYKSLGTDQILAKQIRIGGETLCTEMHKLIHSVQNGEDLP
jgi:hypothetical protein